MSRLKYHHIGIPTQIPQANEIYLMDLKMHVTDHESNPYGIQWMRFDEDCSLPELVKTTAHVAFVVDNLDTAIEGKQVLIEPNSPSPGIRVAFVLENGAPVEFLEID